MKNFLLFVTGMLALSSIYSEDSAQNAMTEKAVLELLLTDLENKLYRAGLDGEEIISQHNSRISLAFKEKNLITLQLVLYTQNYTIPTRVYHYNFTYAQYNVEKVDTPEMEYADQLVNVAACNQKHTKLQSCNFSAHAICE